MTPLLTSVPGATLDEMARNSIRGAIGKSGRRTAPTSRDTLLQLKKAGHLGICDRSDWSVSRASTERLGIRGNWSPLLAHLAYLLRDRVDEGEPLTAIHLGPGDVKLLEYLEKRHVSVRDVLPDGVMEDSSAPILDQSLHTLWQHYGVADKIYMEMTTLLSVVLPTPARADRTTQNQMQELRRYFALSILYRSQHDTPQGKKCASALENVTDIFEIVHHPENYGFDMELGVIPVPGEFEEETFESASEDLRKIWQKYRTDPAQFLTKLGSPHQTSLRAALDECASSHHLLLTKFEHLQLPSESADLIASIRGDSHLSDAEYGKMLEGTVLQALKERGVYMSDGVMASYTRFHTRRLLGFLEATRKSSKQRRYPIQTGLVLTQHPFNGAQRSISSIFAVPRPGDTELDVNPLLKEGCSVVGIAPYMTTIHFAVAAVLEAVIEDTARHQSVPLRQIVKGRHPDIEANRLRISSEIMSGDSTIARKLTETGLPEEDLAALFDPNKTIHQAHPMHQLVTELRESFAKHSRVLPL